MGKIETLRSQNSFCRKFATFCPASFFDPRVTTTQALTIDSRYSI